MRFLDRREVQRLLRRIWRGGKGGFSIAWCDSRHPIAVMTSEPSARGWRCRQGRRPRSTVVGGYEKSCSTRSARRDVWCRCDERRGHSCLGFLYCLARGRAGGFQGEALRHVQNDISKSSWFRNTYIYRVGTRQHADHFRHLSVTRSETYAEVQQQLSISGYHMHEAGATGGAGIGLHHRRWVVEYAKQAMATVPGY